MAATDTKSPAPAAAEDETFEISLPENFMLEDEPEAEADPDADPEKSAEPEPEKKAEPSEAKKTDPDPEPESEKPKAEAKDADADRQPLSEREKRAIAARNEEREKRKEYAKLYASALERAESAERRAKLLSEAPDFEKSPNLKKWWEENVATAAKAATSADDLAIPMKLAVDLAMKDSDRRERALRNELRVELYGIRCDVSQAQAMAKYPDWLEVATKSGVLAAIEDDGKGGFKDPTIGRRVYYNADGSLTDNPGERIYRLSVGKLEYDRQQKGEPETDERPARAERNGHVNEDKGSGKERVATKDEVAKAESRGANKVIDAVAKNSTRLQGIRNLPKAGDGPTRVSKKYLDDLMHSNPTKYEALLKANPELERAHLG